MEKRFASIDRDLEACKATLETSKMTTEADIRVRALIYEQLHPIIIVAKENMLTNCMKNEELSHAREDIRDMARKVNHFEQEVIQIADFDRKILNL